VDIGATSASSFCSCMQFTRQRLQREARAHARPSIQRRGALGLLARRPPVGKVRIVVERRLGDQVGVGLDVRVAALAQVAVDLYLSSPGSPNPPPIVRSVIRSGVSRAMHAWKRAALGAGIDDVGAQRLQHADGAFDEVDAFRIGLREQLCDSDTRAPRRCASRRATRALVAWRYGAAACARR
jgi:hypothetical protein